jgi:hypothetical protein
MDITGWDALVAGLAGILVTALTVLGPKAIAAAGRWLDSHGGGQTQTSNQTQGVQPQ